jgi:hypothetical protein
MSLPWVRLDSGIGQNYKVLALLGDKKHRAFTAYVLGLAYCGQQGSDGYIPKAALPFLHATTKDAADLMAVMLWHDAPGGYQVNDWTDYQPSDEDAQRRGQRARWMNCRRWHPAECDCSPPPPITGSTRPFK